jgi:hypothetical protein
MILILFWTFVVVHCLNTLVICFDRTKSGLASPKWQNIAVVCNAVFSLMLVHIAMNWRPA